MFQKLEQSFHQCGRFTNEHFSMLTEVLSSQNISKGNLLLKAGDVCTGVYFVQEGSFRQYEISPSGLDITLHFFVAGDWIVEHKSFTSQKPSLSNIEATENGRTFFLSLHQLHHLIKRSEVFFQLAHLLERVTENLAYQNNRLSPEEKYRLLLANRPHLIQKFPSKQIASYLGMTPETLSRVRRKIVS